ncbi:single-stranded DNA-binding protein [Campylobacter sputorum]|uniref:single-stranded DNA-binding protein n=1 Tax=Campylobacter sputorum TaxID=206 RepID=UPI00053BEFA5|nr:single-stranded DNA-binding protein [Campylobacter sputorum]
MFNKVVLVGNLTRDIELRYSTSGSAIGNSAIAVTRKYSTQSGEKREETCFIDISFFGKFAEIANQYLSKGSKVLIEGRLKFDQWSDNNGNNKSKHSIFVENMEMLGGNNNTNKNNQYNTNGEQNTGHSKNDYSDEVDFDDNDFNEEAPF